jgi:hypothetical protein
MQICVYCFKLLRGKTTYVFHDFKYLLCACA